MNNKRDYINLEDKIYYISTAITTDAGFESMVFECKDDTKVVEDWTSLYFSHYKTEEDAIRGHEFILNNLEECLEIGKTQDWNEATNNNIFDVINTLLRGKPKGN